MSDQDPTRPQEPVPDEPPPTEATSVYRTETTGAPRQPVPPGPPGSGGVSTGLAIAAAIVVGLIGLLVGYLLFGDEDDDAADIDAVEETVPDDTTELEAERDELAGQVADLEGQVADLQSQLDAVTQERDDLRAQQDAEGDEVETVPAEDVVDGSVEDADQVANDNGWELVERTVQADGEEPGTVVAQYPDPGQPMVEGSVLVVDVAGEPDE